MDQKTLLYVTQTKLVVFKSVNKKFVFKSASVLADFKVENTNFLGIIIDANLSKSFYIQYVKS